MKAKTKRGILLARALKKHKENLPRAYFRSGDFIQCHCPPDKIPWTIFPEEQMDDYLVIRVVEKFSNCEAYDLMHVPSQEIKPRVLIFIHDRNYWKLCSRPSKEVDTQPKSDMFEGKGA